jgi:predicted DNA-binding transcriptional regulator YafY
MSWTCVPIEYDAVPHGYFYAKPVEGFPLLNTTAEDVVALLLARRALEPMQGTPLESSLRESFRRMAQGMRGRISVPWTDFDQAFSAKITGMSRPEISVLEKLAAAVLECREISFDYRKLGATEAAARSLRPYHLVEIDGGWYVIGHDVDRDARRTFAVPRMSNVRVVARRFATESRDPHTAIFPPPNVDRSLRVSWASTFSKIRSGATLRRRVSS